MLAPRASAAHQLVSSGDHHNHNHHHRHHLRLLEDSFSNGNKIVAANSGKRRGRRRRRRAGERRERERGRRRGCGGSGNGRGGMRSIGGSRGALAGGLLVVFVKFALFIAFLQGVSSSLTSNLAASNHAIISTVECSTIQPQVLAEVLGEANLGTATAITATTTTALALRPHSLERRQNPIDNATLELQEGEQQQPASGQQLQAGSGSADGKQAASEAALAVANQQIAAFALAQEASKVASKLNDELCRNFSIGIQYEGGGVFTSPNYPNPYPVNLICKRLIEAPIGHYIVLEFRDQFNIEEAGNDCDNDKIEIRDGRYGYSKVLARYCGSKFPPEVKSTNEAMWLRFISDASITHNGFKAVYRFERQKNIKPNPPFECRFNVTSMESNAGNPLVPFDNRTGIHSGIIRNSDVPDKLINYTKEFNVSLECIWNITVMPGWKIYLTFSIYELNKPNDCDSNFIEIYEENLTEENQTVKFCGTRTEPQQSKSNVFNIRHHALPTASGSRFEIIYTAFRDKGLASCYSGEFDCDDGTCIHDSLKCDGQVNCKYRYDEASDPGPCISLDQPSGFFETEHMVIILIVFLTLVGGMCASIIVSCWGKIQERRRRKLEYHVRKSREASMEGQLNKVDQILYGTSGGGESRSSQAAVAGANVAAINALKQQQNNHVLSGGQQAPVSKQYSLEASSGLSGSQRQLLQLANNQQQQLQQYQQQQQQLMSQMLADGGAAAAASYGLFQADQRQQQQQAAKSLDLQQTHPAFFGARSKVHDLGAPEVNKSLQNSILASMAASQQQQVDQLSKQQSVPIDSGSSFNNQFNHLQQQQLQTGAGSQHQLQSISSETLDAAQQQQMLNLSLAARNHLSQQPQQQQKYLSSIYQQQLDNNSSSNNGNSGSLYGRFIGRQANMGPLGSHIPSGLNQSASAQTMPISLAKLNLLQASVDAGGQQMGYDGGGSGARFAGTNYPATNQQPTIGGNGISSTNQRALTLSAMHQPLAGQQHRNLQAIYGLAPNPHHQAPGAHLSSSITCCNLLPDESPLLSDLLARANQQQQEQQRIQFPPQNNRIYELRSATLGPRLPSGALPRSISAHQLSKAHLRQSQQQNQSQAQQQIHQQQQQQQQVHQLSYKSMSDAGHTIRHQPPNHSISYPHACTGAHQLQHEQQELQQQQQRGNQQSPALPPPPPPPNLVQARSSTACGAPLPVAPISSRRAAFKVSRLETSQLTGDTLQDADLMIGASSNMPLGSLQFDDQSSESDATFGMLMNSIGNPHPQSQAQAHTNIDQLNYVIGGSSAAGSGQLQRQAQQPLPAVYLPQKAQILTHLSDCNFVRGRQLMQQQQQQQLQQTGRPSVGQLICDCGALERANLQQRHQLQLQLHQASSSHEFDDSDFQECQKFNPATFVANLGSDQAEGQLIVKTNGGSVYARSQRQQFARFRHQSSELTNDDDEDEVDEDDEEDEADEDDVIEDDLMIRDYSNENADNVACGVAINNEDASSSEPIAGVSLEGTGLTQIDRYETTRRSLIRNEEALRDAPQSRHLSGSHTSISCQSCTCGSQLQLNQQQQDDEQQSPGDNLAPIKQGSGEKGSFRQAATMTDSANKANKEICDISNNASGYNQASNNNISGGQIMGGTTATATTKPN